MKKGKLQCKDIPEIPILVFLYINKGTWCNWFPLDFKNSVRWAMPLNTPPKLICAKMASMINKGLVEGCPCGCRGDYEITEKGEKLILDQ